MQVPYEYHRSQTLASKFALLTLTQRQYVRLVDSSVGYFADAQYDVKSPIGTSRLAMAVEFKKCGGGKIASAALVRLRVKINIKLFSE